MINNDGFIIENSDSKLVEAVPFDISDNYVNITDDHNQYHNPAGNTWKGRKVLILSILAPLIFGIILVILNGYNDSPISENVMSFASTAKSVVSNMKLSKGKIDSIILNKGGHCSYNISYCTDNSVPVLNGLDFVQFFVEFKIAEGVYNETEMGVAGSAEYSYVYHNYTFLFKSNENKDLFVLSPETYLPQVNYHPP